MQESRFHETGIQPTMVVFSCDGCGEMLKKSQVDVHAGRCRRCDSVSCVDCSVSFFGDDFRTHTACISEAERYEKSVYKGNSGNKKQKKNPQEAWMELVLFASSNAPHSIRQHMGIIASLDNVPRKPKQFRNFTSNSLNLRGNNASKIVDEMWKYLSELREKEQVKRKADEEEVQQKKSLDQSIENDNGDVPSRKETNDERKDLSASGSSKKEKPDENLEELKLKKIGKAMRKALKRAPNRSMKVKVLRQSLLDSLGLKKDQRKRLKQAMRQQIEADTKRLKVDGKLVTLL